MNYIRRVLGYVPTNANGKRPCGLVQVGMGHDGHFYVDGDFSGTAETVNVPAVYMKNEVDYLVTGPKPTTLLEALAENVYGLMIEDVGIDERPKAKPGTLYVKQTPESVEHVQTLSSLYRRGRVQYAKGAGLTELEREMTAPHEQVPAAVRALAIVVMDLVVARTRTSARRY
jgi:phage terminase large subunit-like protein